MRGKLVNYMKMSIWGATVLLVGTMAYAAEGAAVMGEKYLAYWSEAEQSRIDEDIRANRMAEAALVLTEVPAGTEVEVEQLTHHFIFGANIFLFGDMKSPELNKRYEDTFGDIFNAATVPFYWKTLEQERGKPRYAVGSSYEYRRPPPDAVVEFCESKGINMNGHALIYGMRRWGHPEWMPEDRKAMEPIFKAHVKEVAERYKGRIQRWDIVNESIDQANRGLMPDDYTYKTFKWAEEYFPKSVQFSINDCDMKGAPSRRYVEIARDLIDRGVRIDTVGVQMHIFDPKQTAAIAQGADILTPKKNRAWLDCLREAERPIHISEVTVSATEDGPQGEAVQAAVARNLYRIWFSYAQVMGITWWNVVDGGAAPGEPSYSGLYDKEMNHKQVYATLDRLINHEWRTRERIKVATGGKVQFRGFRGRYRVSWQTTDGKRKSIEFDLIKDGDGA